jgi:glycosyltransferase involved in cell wall biosynthesis
MNRVSIVIPMLNEAEALPRLIRTSASFAPAPFEIIAVDGGSDDDSVALASAAGWQVITAPKGRAIQINHGVEAAQGEIICILHADTILPDDAIAVMQRAMADARTALAGFTPLICGPDRVRWGTSFHNWIKTWYAPLFLKTLWFFQGMRLLFGDHAMFFRRADFLTVGGCNPGEAVMEEADLCYKFTRIGRTRLINRIVLTSDRRVAAWGPWRANWIYFKVGVLWAFGAKKRLASYYPDVR